jgi:hypothetical protein
LLVKLVHLSAGSAETLQPRDLSWQLADFSATRPLQQVKLALQSLNLSFHLSDKVFAGSCGKLLATRLTCIKPFFPPGLNAHIICMKE